MLRRIVKVMPREYKRALAEQARRERSRASRRTSRSVDARSTLDGHRGEGRRARMRERPVHG